MDGRGLKSAIRFWVITRLIFTSERRIWYSFEPHRGAWHKNRKKLAKIKIDFFDLFGVGGAGWQCHSVLIFFYIAVPFFFENVFYRVKFGTFWGSGDKVHFWLVEIQKVMEILKIWNLTGGSRICSCVHHGPAWYLVRHGFRRNYAWSGALKNRNVFLRVAARV